MALALLPDVERAVSLALRDEPELAPIAARVFTVVPKNVGADPFVIVRRFGGEPTVPRPLVHERADLQLDSYGGTKAVAQKWARSVAAVLAELAGVVSDGDVDGWISGTTVGALRYLPDEIFEPARPRYVLDVEVFVRSARSAVPIG